MMEDGVDEKVEGGKAGDEERRKNNVEMRDGGGE